MPCFDALPKAFHAVGLDFVGSRAAARQGPSAPRSRVGPSLVEPRFSELRIIPTLRTVITLVCLSLKFPRHKGARLYQMYSLQQGSDLPSPKSMGHDSYLSLKRSVVDRCKAPMGYRS
jgi:hypothetical protein